MLKSVTLSSVHRVIDAVYNDTGHPPQCLLLGYMTAAELGLPLARDGGEFLGVPLIVCPSRAIYAEAIPSSRCVGCKTLKPQAYSADGRTG